MLPAVHEASVGGHLVKETNHKERRAYEAIQATPLASWAPAYAGIVEVPGKGDDKSLIDSHYVKLRLQNVTRHLQSRTASLTVHYAGVTHLAAGHATLTLDGGARNEGASMVARPLSAVRARPGKGGGAGAPQRATTHTVPTINLVQWLSARLDELPG